MLQDTVDHSSASDNSKHRSSARPKAQARAQPKPLSRQGTRPDMSTLTSPPLSTVLSGASMASISSVDNTNAPAATLSKATSILPSWDQVSRLLLDGTSGSSTSTKINLAKSMPIWATPSLVLRIKFELLFAYGMAHVQNILERRDLDSEPGWNTSLKDGSLSRLMDAVFFARGSNEDEDALFYRSLLKGAFELPGTWTCLASCILQTPRIRFTTIFLEMGPYWSI